MCVNMKYVIFIYYFYYSVIKNKKINLFLHTV